MKCYRKALLHKSYLKTSCFCFPAYFCYHLNCFRPAHLEWRSIMGGKALHKTTEREREPSLTCLTVSSYRTYIPFPSVTSSLSAASNYRWEKAWTYSKIKKEVWHTGLLFAVVPPETHFADNGLSLGSICVVGLATTTSIILAWGSFSLGMLSQENDGSRPSLRLGNWERTPFSIGPESTDWQRNWPFCNAGSL